VRLDIVPRIDHQMSPRLAPVMTTAVAKVFLGHADVTDSYVEPSLDEVRDAIPPGTIASPSASRYTSRCTPLWKRRNQREERLELSCVSP
jgi:hypothetical protein